jgi:nitrate reductase gamma subunit
MEVEKSKIAPKPTKYRRKAFEITGAVALLGVVVAIARWLETDVLHETTNGDGLANLVLLAVVVVCVVAGLLVGQIRRGAHVIFDRMRNRRRHA